MEYFIRSFSNKPGLNKNKHIFCFPKIKIYLKKSLTAEKEKEN